MLIAWEASYNAKSIALIDVTLSGVIDLVFKRFLLQDFVDLIDELLYLVYSNLYYFLHVTTPSKPSQIASDSWKYAYANEFEKYDEDLFSLKLTMNITIAYSCSGCSNKVECIDVNHRYVIFLMIKKNPFLPALFLFSTNENPDASQCMEKNE